MSSHLHLDLPKGLFLAVLPVKMLKALLPSSILATRPAHLSFLDLNHPDNVRWTLQTMKFLIVEPSRLPYSCNYCIKSQLRPWENFQYRVLTYMAMVMVGVIMKINLKIYRICNWMHEYWHKCFIALQTYVFGYMVHHTWYLIRTLSRLYYQISTNAVAGRNNMSARLQYVVACTHQ